MSAYSTLLSSDSSLARRMSLHHGLTTITTSLPVLFFLVDPGIFPSQLEILSMGKPYF